MPVVRGAGGTALSSSEEVQSTSELDDSESLARDDSGRVAAVWAG